MKIRKVVVECLGLTCFALNGVGAALLLVGKGKISAEVGIRLGYLATDIDKLRRWVEKP